MATGNRTAVLFVCLGNICRSPLAEAVFRHLLRERGLEDRFEIDSAGTSAYHIGDSPDARTTSTALARDVTVAGRARQFIPEDLKRFDHVVVMDAENLAAVERIRARTGDIHAEINLLRHWDEMAEPDEGVPDPYFGGPTGFDNVQDIVERSCERLLDHLMGKMDRA